MRSTTKMVAFALVSLSLAVAAVSGAFAQESQPQDAPDSGPAPAAAENGKRARARFSIFADGRLGVHDQEITRAYASRMPRAMAEDIDPQLTRQVRAGHVDIYVLAGSGTLCLVRREASGTGALGCTTNPEASTAQDSLLYGWDHVAEGYRFTALVPDGVASVSVADATGVARSLRTKDNLITGIFASAPVSVEWQDTAGSVQTLKVTQ